MHKLVFILVVSCFLSDLYGQKEIPSYRKLVTKFNSMYNRSSFDSIFYLFSPEMIKALPLDKTKSFFDDIKREAGQIISSRFEKVESSYAFYKVACERRVLLLNISLDSKNKINGLFIQPYTDTDLPQIERNTTKLILPFTGSWTVMWGGDTREQNYHIEVPVQKNAFDFIVTDSSGKSYKTNSLSNEDYYAFAKDIISPCDGEVVSAVDGIKDNIPGQTNPMFVTGNTIILKTANGEYLLFAHFKKHSLLVKEGERVKQGQVLGRCGNSGNSSEPHLHFHIQNVEDINIGTGVKCYFERIKVNRSVKTNYSPVKGDRIQNIDN